MSSYLERLSLMAGVVISEAETARLKAIKIKLADVGLDHHPDEVVLEFVSQAVEANDLITIEDYRINHATGNLEFYPMSPENVSPSRISNFRNFMFEFLSDLENTHTHESVQERKLTPKELKKREEIATAIERDQPGMDKSKKMAIATAQAKKMSESKTGSMNKKKRSRSSGITEDTNYDEEGNPIPVGPVPQGIAQIAQSMLGFQTLDPRNSDQLDFKEVSVTSIRDALVAAYELGKQQGTDEETPAAQQPLSGAGGRGTGELPPPTPRTSADHQQAGPIGTAR